MKLAISFFFAIVFMVVSPPRSARADDETEKAASGQKFLEVGGKGTPTAGAPTVNASGGSGGVEAMNLVNASGGSAGLKTADVPAPKKGDALGKAVGTAKGAIYGTVAGGVIGAVAGAVGGPAGVLGGAVAGAKLGAMAGAALGALAGFMLAGKAGNSSGGILEERQQALDDAMKGN